MKTWLRVRPGFICMAFLDERFGGWEYGVHCARCRRGPPPPVLDCRFCCAANGGPHSAPGGKPHTLPSVLRAMDEAMRFHRRQFAKHHRELRKVGGK